MTIPGSMETKSFLCRGTGSALSHGSVSHGAGRQRSRGQMMPKVLVKDANGEILRDNGGYHRVDREATALAIAEAATQMVREMSEKRERDGQTSSSHATPRVDRTTYAGSIPLVTRADRARR